MEESVQLEKLLTDGYQIVGPVTTIADLSKHSPMSNYIKVFSVETNHQILLDPRNRNKTFIILRHPSTRQRVEIITSDGQTINRALTQKRYQDEPVAQRIRAQCSALGGRSSNEKLFSVDELIPSLDGFRDWKFKLGETSGVFEATKEIQTPDRGAAEEALDQLSHILDSLAYLHHVGFFIQHSHTVLIPREEVEHVVSLGPERSYLPAMTNKEIQDLEILSTSPKAIDALKGLNQSYVENCMPSRLSMLWAAIEHVFLSKPERLLSNDEIKELLIAAAKIDSLKKDTQRLTEFKKCLKDPGRLSLKTRNDRLAEAIAPVMNISIESAKSKVRDASGLRGKNVHSLTKNWDAVKDAEAFLQQALTSYIASTLISNDK